MAYLFNNPTDFADQLTDGFAAAYPQWIRKVPGGVVRSNGTAPGSVVVIAGGGSGHYPAFAGLVGPGLVHGAAMGNIFASPSAQQIYSVAKSAHAGGGVLLTYGNYAGDVLNFTLAQDRLNAEGIRTLMVAVTDDISSASVDEIDKRRGIAGDLAVFKAAGACADAGGDLDEVFRVATRANERTRSFGIAFSGCTLPGASAPLFSVPAGRMAVGMGIHGEPGISEQDLPTADDAAELMVRSLLAEVPEDLNGRRVGVILNGLGSVKSEELFVVYRKIAQLLDFAGIIVVDPEVGELVTSFEMAGVSLTLFWLDDELEKYWTAPASTPAFRKGAASGAGPRYASETPDESAKTELPDASVVSREAAAQVQKLLESVQAVIDENVDELGRLDSIAGDGDHGIGMQRGTAAAAAAGRAALAGGAGAGTLLSVAADAWADRAGGTSGVLWGMIIKSIGQSLGDNEPPTASSISQGVAEAGKQVMQFGKAEPGDKTLVDVLIPFSRALTAGIRSGNPPEKAWHAAADVADAAATSTASLLPRMGRARPHAEKSVGTPDPGAVSMAMIIRTVERGLARKGESND
ncbi:dihydroxyacetone kinase family protein [Pseudarthrobacter sp. NIBRBAC000502772]|uniref:dihydroxyacetone kinase family protein n=1 Tax=Pseudarthrobacter sp. NIBRBAC000502772 TaxID=2590775 RepID=UPI001132828B|nr:dihydroxyacetone kinase family protein [Pseudarthrobacter sp. NIBRBAC000502772]QDG65282.1 dihydroxyacetone kinase family protein [Pseudarthrobacter sp. NIBRBAC000502772]